MKLARIAHRKGLFALEYEASFIPKDLPLCSHIVKMIELICDGTEPDFVEEIMTIKFLANNYEGIDAILFFLYTRSMLMIQAGTPCILLEEMFQSVVSGTDLVLKEEQDS